MKTCKTFLPRGKRKALKVTWFCLSVLYLDLQTFQDWRWPLLHPAQHWWLRMNMTLMGHRVYPPLRVGTPFRPSSIHHPAAARPPLSHLQLQTCSPPPRPPPRPQRRPSLPLLLDQAVRYSCKVCFCVCALVFCPFVTDILLTFDLWRYFKLLLRVPAVGSWVCTP